MPPTHTFVRDLEGGRQKLWKLSEPFSFSTYNDPTRTLETKSTDHIITSQCNEDTRRIQGCSEIYSFPAAADGSILDWCELPGSSKGDDVTHEEVISNFHPRPSDD